MTNQHPVVPISHKQGGDLKEKGETKKKTLVPGKTPQRIKKRKKKKKKIRRFRNSISRNSLSFGAWICGFHAAAGCHSPQHTPRHVPSSPQTLTFFFFFVFFFFGLRRSASGDRTYRGRHFAESQSLVPGSRLFLFVFSVVLCSCREFLCSPPSPEI